MIRRSLAGLVAVLVTFALCVPPAGAAPYKPREGAHFNVPRPWGNHAARWRLMHKMDAAIDHTPAGAKILISAYLFDRWRTVNRLIDAKRRGVRVRVVLDSEIEAQAATRLMKVLNRDNVRSPVLEKRWGRDGSFAMMCRGACRGDKGGSVHTKFYAFSEVCRARQRNRADKCRVPSAKKIVMFSSANPNGGGASRGWNDMYIMVNRPITYWGYERMHREMSENSRGDGDRLVQFKDGPFVHRFYPMRSSTRSTDPTMQDLAKVHCRGVGRGAGFRGRTAIHVSMFWWANRRGEYIARRILQLAREGCNVNLIYGAPSRVVAGMLRGPARKGLINLYDSRWWFNERDPEVSVRSHHKYVLVNGHVGSNRTAQQVWTGSLNWSGANVTWDDDVTLKINRTRAYLSYLDNWRDVRKHSRRIPKPRSAPEPRLGLPDTSFSPYEWSYLMSNR